MQIRHMKTRDFQGLSGKREFDFDHINCYCLNQGTGKTSILNAIRYGLSGQEPEGEMIHIGAGQCAVALQTGNGTEIIRQKTINRQTINYVNEKKVTRQTADEVVSAEAGVMPHTIRIASSGDIVKALKPSEFGNLIREYTPELLDTARIKGYIPDMTPEMNTVIEGGFPVGTFGVNTVSAFHKNAVDTRRALKRDIQRLEAAIQEYRKYPLPEKKKEELKEEEVKLRVLLKEEENYEKNLKAYNEAVKNKQQHEALLKALKEDLEKNKAVFHSDEERQAVATALARTKENRENAKDAGNNMYLVAVRTKKVLETLNTSRCPISDKLVCTTDKTSIREELEETVKKAEEGVEKQRVVLKEMDEAIKKYEERLKAFDEERLLFLQKQKNEALLKQQASIVMTIPEKPVKPDTENIAARMRQVTGMLTVIDMHEKAAKADVELAAARKQLECMEAICRAFDPKGVVMSRITEDYMTAFEDEVNKKAEKLKTGMRVKFVSEGGVHVYVDMRGDGKFLNYTSLSGGERAMYIYLMLDLLNSLSQLRILFLDELSVLDEETFRSLIVLIMEHKDEYDHIFIATVNHTDTLNVLAENGIFTKDIPESVTA